MLVGAKIGYPEQNWDPKSVTRNKTGIQNWLPRTNLGSKIGYPEQTWDPKLVTQRVSGKVYNMCLESVWVVSKWCQHAVLMVSGPCLDVV